MVQGYEVLQMLRPNGGWVIYGDNFDSIIYDEEVSPITQKEFEDGFALVENHKVQTAAATAAAKAALLAKLGITEEEARLLLGGN